MELVTRNRTVVEQYRDTLKSMKLIAQEFGITPDRVRQIIVAYEKANGVKLPRKLSDRVLVVFPPTNPLPAKKVNHRKGDFLRAWNEWHQ